VDVEGVSLFLNACEAEGISVLHCSPYIRGMDGPGTKSAKARTHKRKKEQAPLED